MNGWNDNKYPTFDPDTLREEAEIERHEFEEAMAKHITANPKGCDSPKCVYCNTYGQMMADMDAAELSGSEFVAVGYATDSDIPF